MKKKISLIFSFLIIISFFLFYTIGVSKNCKRHSLIKIFKSVSDLGFNQISKCYSKQIALVNIKNILSFNEFFYQTARKFRRNYIMSSFKYDNAFDNEKLEYVKIKNEEEKNLKKPF